MLASCDTSSLNASEWHVWMLLSTLRNMATLANKVLIWLCWIYHSKTFVLMRQLSILWKICRVLVLTEMLYSVQRSRLCCIKDTSATFVDSYVSFDKDALRLLRYAPTCPDLVTRQAYTVFCMHIFCMHIFMLFIQNSLSTAVGITMWRQASRHGGCP
jgi:hypothetical protein